MTARKLAILTFVGACASRSQVLPTLAEIGEAVGLRAASTVTYHLNELRALGLIEPIGWSEMRSVRPTLAGWDFLGMEGDWQAAPIPTVAALVPRPWPLTPTGAMVQFKGDRPRAVAWFYD